MGNGKDIILGINSISGTQPYPELSSDFRDYLDDMGIAYLSQAHNSLPGQHPYWYTVEDLNVVGYWKDQWEIYTSYLEGARIRLNSCIDCMTWDYNQNDGSVNVKLIYDCIIHSSLHPNASPLLTLIWSCNLSMKIICFIWLTLHNKVLSWDNLQKRGWICLFLSESLSFEFSLGVGSCTNTKVELIALWALLHISQTMGIPTLNIFDDSAVIISWVKGTSALRPPTLSH